MQLDDGGISLVTYVVRFTQCEVEVDVSPSRGRTKSIYSSLSLLADLTPQGTKQIIVELELQLYLNYWRQLVVNLCCSSTYLGLRLIFDATVSQAIATSSLAIVDARLHDRAVNCLNQACH